MDSDTKTKLQKFHGPNYCEGTWNSKSFSCCRLCKTTNTEAKFGHWSKGLCRSCYRRLSTTHRVYNDTWNKENVKALDLRKSASKKAYKTLEETAQFTDIDVESLLVRYNYSCAYCITELQGHDHKTNDAFQIEYRIAPEGASLVPICRACNCSKKNITDEVKLKRWARSKGLAYPINFIDPLKN